MNLREKQANDDRRYRLLRRRRKPSDLSEACRIAARLTDNLFLKEDLEKAAQILEELPAESSPLPTTQEVSK